MYSQIQGTGRCLPDRVVSNFDLEKIMDTSDEWIRTRTGIERRCFAGEGDTLANLCIAAAQEALSAAGIAANDIDLVVIGTLTPDLTSTDMVRNILTGLGIPECPAFTLEAACSGFLYGLGIADKFVASGQANRALVIGAEILSRILDFEDRSTAVLFGDGAGAAVLAASEEAGILSTHLHSNGQQWEMLYAQFDDDGELHGRTYDGAYVRMRGNELFKVAVTCLGSVVVETLEANNLEKSDIDWLVPHQANIRIIEATAKRLKMPMDKVILTLQDHGNTSAASVPMALDVAIRDGRIQRGDLILLEAFGGGITWGAALIRY